MAHFLQYRLGPADDGKEVLFLMQKVLGLTTKKGPLCKAMKSGEFC